MIKYVVEHGVNPGVKGLSNLNFPFKENSPPADEEGRTPMYIAAAEGNQLVVEYLIAKGANVNDHGMHVLP